MMFVDASFWVALFLNNDPNYQRAARAWPEINTEKITSEDILKETLTIVSQRINKAGSITAYEKIIDECTVLPVSSDRYRAGLQLFLNPKLQKNVSVIDCISAAMCRELNIGRILALDAHFKQLGLTVVP